MPDCDPFPLLTFYERPWLSTTSPWLSSVPAKSEPIITVSAPAASAFTMSHEYLIPPSAISGTPWRRQTSAASITAVSCGAPTQATVRVVQIEPGPTPTRTDETWALTRATAPPGVATM